MNIFAYRKILICLADFAPFKQEQLWELARLAGKRGNFDLIADLRKEDAYLTGYILEGAREADNPNLLQTVERMLVPFSSYTLTDSSRTATDPDSKTTTISGILLLCCVFLISFILGTATVIFRP